jgi:multidrug efflux pump subunit AcrA (membrane-fusion protein)
LQTATVRRGDIVLYASGTGTLIPAAEASFGFETSGQVVEVLVGVGDQVEAGQILARLDDTSAQSSLASTRREYLELTSQTSIVAARQQAAELEDTLNSARATLGWLVSPSVVTWEERVAAAETALQQAKDAGASDKISEAEKNLKLAQSNLTYAHNAYYDYLVENFAETETVGSRGGTYEVIIKDENGNPVIDYPTDLEITLARSEYELAQAKLQEARWYLSALQGEEIPDNATGSNLAALEKVRSNLDSAKSNLDTTQLVAPIVGTVMSLDFSVGDNVNTGAVITIADLSVPYLEIFLDETDWDKIAVGYPVEVTFDAIEEKIYTGKVIQVDPGLSSQQNASFMRGVVELDPLQSGLNLPIGAAAAVDIIGGRAENAVLVPVDALRETSPGQYAVFVMENDKPALRVVEIGLKDLFYAEVLSGLEPGDVVSTGLVETQ